MSQGFWRTLPKPLFVMAPLAGVTDAAFRPLIAAYGRPHALWTEFTSADGLCSPGRARLLRDLAYTEAERPIIAQLYGSNPTTMERAAALVAELGFDGLDINMGCPDRSVEKRGAGAALSQRPALAQALIRAAQRGAGTLPVSVKIRLGYHSNELDTWLPALLETEPAVVTLHARTRQEMSKVPAHWDLVTRAVEIRQGQGSKTYIIGNGDVPDLAAARHKIRLTGADGVMFGRAIFGNPWLFNEHVHVADIPVLERLRVMLEHTQLFAALLSDIKSPEVMKKHYKVYVTGFWGAKDLFIQLMATQSVAEVEAAVQTFQEVWLRRHGAGGHLAVADTPRSSQALAAPDAYPHSRAGNGPRGVLDYIRATQKAFM